MNRLSIAAALSLLCVSSIAAQSLWSPDKGRPLLIGDLVARHVGDPITINVTEVHTLRNLEWSDFRKEAELDAQLTNFNILPDAFNTLPGVTGETERIFRGQARYDKDGRLQARISALVIDVMPNGNLLIEGRRTVVMDRETKTIRVTGIVRPFDIGLDNVVLSSRIANASIAFEGVGMVSRNVNRGWLGDLLDYVWPF